MLNFKFLLNPRFAAVAICIAGLTACGFQDEIANRPSAEASSNQNGPKIDSSYQYRVNDGYDKVVSVKNNDTQIKQDVKQAPINDPFVVKKEDDLQQVQPVADVKDGDLQVAKEEVQNEELKKQEEPSQATAQPAAVATVLPATKPANVALQQEVDKKQISATNATKYTVQQGDTMFGISKKSGKSIASIKELNNLPQDSDKVYIGQVLILQLDKPEPKNLNAVGQGAGDDLPSFHVVQAKETAYSISKRYNIPLANLASLNNLNEQYALQKDQKLLLKPLSSQPSQQNIEANSQYTPKAKALVQAQTEQKPKQEEKVLKQASVQSGYAYPSTAKIVSYFGEGKKGLYNDGLLFDVQLESDVFAAKEGTVFFASFVKNYQNLIILKHDDGLLSVYGNLDSMIVKKGDFVSKGQQVGTVSPRTTKTLFFSIRNTNKALNPLNYIK